MTNTYPRRWLLFAGVSTLVLVTVTWGVRWFNRTTPPERPETIELVATIPTGFINGSQIAEINGGTLCLAGPATQVNFYHLTNPVAPTLFSRVEVPGTTKGIAHLPGYFYLSGEGWLRTYSAGSNIAASMHSEVLLSSNILARLKVRDGNLFAAASTFGRPKQGRIFIFSLTNPAVPRLAATLVSPPLSGFADLEVRDNLLYVADYFGKRMEVYDLTDLQNPQRLHSQTIENRHNYSSFEPWRMLLKGDALYLQDDESWQVFSLRDRANPSYRFDIQGARDVEGTQLVGDILMWSASGVGDTVSGVLIYDCRNAFHPKLLARLDFGEFKGYAWGTMDEHYIYQPDGASLHIMKVPELPPFVGKKSPEVQ